MTSPDHRAAVSGRLSAAGDGKAPPVSSQLRRDLADAEKRRQALEKDRNTLEELLQKAEAEWRNQERHSGGNRFAGLELGSGQAELEALNRKIYKLRTTKRETEQRLAELLRQSETLRAGLEGQEPSPVTMGLAETPSPSAGYSVESLVAPRGRSGKRAGMVFLVFLACGAVTAIIYFTGKPVLVAERLKQLQLRHPSAPGQRPESEATSPDPGGGSVRSVATETDPDVDARSQIENVKRMEKEFAAKKDAQAYAALMPILDTIVKDNGVSRDLRAEASYWKGVCYDNSSVLSQDRQERLRQLREAVTTYSAVTRAFNGTTWARYAHDALLNAQRELTTLEQKPVPIQP